MRAIGCRFASRAGRSAGWRRRLAERAQTEMHALLARSRGAPVSRRWYRGWEGRKGSACTALSFLASSPWAHVGVMACGALKSRLESRECSGAG